MSDAGGRSYSRSRGDLSYYPRQDARFVNGSLPRWASKPVHLSIRPPPGLWQTDAALQTAPVRTAVPPPPSLGSCVPSTQWLEDGTVKKSKSRDARMVYDLEYFRSIPLYTNWKDHNIALKFLREHCEANNHTVFWLDSAVPVPEIDHPKGTSFSFNPDVTNPWEWQQMVAQLSDESMQFVVEGEDGRSRGIVNCCLFQTSLYDHKRHVPARTQATRTTAVAGGQNQANMMCVWDFKLTRDDDSFIMLHPNYSKTKVEYKVHEASFDGELPRSGLGGTGRKGVKDNRGTFQYFIRKGVDGAVRFDAQKTVKKKAYIEPIPTAGGGPSSSTSGLWQ